MVVCGWDRVSENEVYKRGAKWYTRQIIFWKNFWVLRGVYVRRVYQLF